MLQGGQVRYTILIFRQNQNCPFLKIDRLADTFYLDKKVSNKCKMLWGKSFENFFDTQKKNCFRTLFWKKHFKKFGKFFKGENIFKIKKKCFFQKSVLKKKLIWVSKNVSKLFSHIILYFFENFWAKKKCPINCLFSKTDSFNFSLK